MKINKTLLSIIIFLLLFLSHCKNEYPFVSEDEINEMNPAVEDVCFIFNKDVYILESSEDLSAKRITFTPTVYKSDVKISHNGKKIAYLLISNSPVIIDRDGNTIEELNQYTYVDQLDWSADDETLFMLINNDLEFYGPAMDIPDITIPDFIPLVLGANTSVISADISVYNDLAYVVKYYDYPGGYTSIMVIKENDGSNSERIVYGHGFDRISYVNFSGHAQDLAVGFSYDYGNEYGIVELYNNLKSSPYATYEFNDDHCSPNYRSDVNYYVAGNYDSYPNDHYFLRIARTVTSESKIIDYENYNGNEHNFFIDWK